jgi:hypothetical protein
MGAKPGFGPHVLQQATPTAAFAEPDGCNTGNNSSRVSPPDPVEPDPCPAGIRLPMPDLTLTQPVRMSSNVPATGVTFRVRNMGCPNHPFSMPQCVTSPAPKLKSSVAAKRQMASSQPIMPTLKKNISGSMDGDAIQNDITGARGTPLMSNDAITGMTPQEQKGLKAPTTVARAMAVNGLVPNARLMYLEAPDIWIATARGIVTSR